MGPVPVQELRSDPTHCDTGYKAKPGTISTGDRMENPKQCFQRMSVFPCLPITELNSLDRIGGTFLSSQGAGVGAGGLETQLAVAEEMLHVTFFSLSSATVPVE